MLYENGTDPSVTYINSNRAMQWANFDLQRVIPYLYWNYTAFNIKLESFCTRTNAYTGDNQYCLLHMRGLPWVNGLDTLQTYQDSRVIELVSFESTVQINNWTYSFPSNCNQTMFLDHQLHGLRYNYF